jgi:WD40 repeat protein
MSPSACQDGMIRIWKYGEGSSTTIIDPLYVLDAHQARVFSVLWSPLVPGLLASGSDDRSVLVWEVCHSVDLLSSVTTQVPIMSATPPPPQSEEARLSPIRRLEGHT